MDVELQSSVVPRFLHKANQILSRPVEMPFLAPYCLENVSIGCEIDRGAKWYARNESRGPLAIEQDPVRSENGIEAGFDCKLDHFGKLLVKERLTIEGQIDITIARTRFSDAIEKELELRQLEVSHWAMREVIGIALRTETAAKIAGVCGLYCELVGGIR